MTRSSDTHPYFIRLAVDLDPNGNPIGGHATLYQGGKDEGALFILFPDPFDSAADAWAEVLTTYSDLIGQQLELFGLETDEAVRRSR